jgi:hypothetical protein
LKRFGFFVGSAFLDFSFHFMGLPEVGCHVGTKNVVGKQNSIKCIPLAMLLHLSLHAL